MMSTDNDIISIILVDDHAIVRSGTREVLNAHPHLSVIGETGSGDCLEELIRKKTPQILLLDINLPGRNGFELLKQLKVEFPALKIILFSAYTDPPYIQKGIALDADGYISKTVSTEELQSLVLQCGQSGMNTPVYSEDIILQLVQARPSEAISSAAPSLTAREKEILFQIAHGHTNKNIAAELVLSVKTVDTHVSNLMKKLGVNNRSQLTAYAYENHLI